MPGTIWATGWASSWPGAAYVLSRRRPNAAFTYGLGQSSILAALFNALLLLIAVGAIAWEAVQRLIHPEPVVAGIVMAVAAVGILVNGATAMLFASGRKGDLNVHAAFMHMMADAGVSAAVVVAGLVISFTGWLWVDPVASLAVNAVILFATWGILRQAVTMAVAGVPDSVDLRRREAASGCHARRRRGARPARLAAVDDGDGTLLPPGDARQAIRGMPISWQRASNSGSTSASATRPSRSRRTLPCIAPSPRTRWFEFRAYTTRPPSPGLTGRSSWLPPKRMPRSSRGKVKAR